MEKQDLGPIIKDENKRDFGVEDQETQELLKEIEKEHGEEGVEIARRIFNLKGHDFLKNIVGGVNLEGEETQKLLKEIEKEHGEEGVKIVKRLRILS